MRTGLTGEPCAPAPAVNTAPSSAIAAMRPTILSPFDIRLGLLGLKADLLRDDSVADDILLQERAEFLRRAADGDQRLLLQLVAHLRRGDRLRGFGVDAAHDVLGDARRAPSG